MQDLFERINAQSGWECSITGYDGWKLVFSGGSSESHGAPFAEFSGVSFLSCPTQFSHPKFRLADELERHQVGAVVPLETSDLLVAIEAETMARHQRHVFFVAAESVELAKK
jgi:hypothetical protein